MRLAADARKASRRLHEVLPCLPFRVKCASQSRIDAVVGSEGCAGAEVVGKRGYVLLVSPHQTTGEIGDTMIHEAAHALADSRNAQESDAHHHGALWGKCYAEVYRAFHGVD